MSTVEISELIVRFGRVLAVDGASLKLEADESVGIIGPNGAGKSTFVKALAGVVPLSRGSIKVDGDEIGGRGVRGALGEGIVLVPQGRRLFGSMSVRENLTMGAFARNDRAAEEASIKWLTEFFPEIRDKLDAVASSLSGGQQQIVAVARGLMASPQTLVLDEPSMGVAPKVIDRLVEELNRLNRDGIGIMLVEQNIELALAVCDRIVILSQGRIVYDGGTEPVRDPDFLASHFFGSASL